jgi:hypothetical protein
VAEVANTYEAPAWQGDKASAAPDNPDAWGWTGELRPPELTALGPVSLHLLLRAKEWVNRRVETVDLIDETRVRRQISIDFRLPENLPGGVTLGGERTHMLPLTFLPRNSELAYFDVRDQDGTALPILTRQENARMTGLILVEAARRALDKKRVTAGLSEALQTYLAVIPTKPWTDARVFVRSILDPETEFLYPDRSVADALLADDDFLDLLGICQSCSVIHVPLTTQPGRRRILKLAWEWQWIKHSSSDSPDDGRGRLVRAWAKLGRRSVALRRWIGWRPRVRYLMTPHVGGAESYHVQISVPSGVELTEAGMYNAPARTLLGARPASDEAVAARRSPGSDRYEPFEPGIASRAHLYVQRSHEHRAGMVWG